MSDTPGPLIVIGGHEDKKRDRTILKEVAARLGSGKLVIATVASHEPDGYFDAYKAAFAAIGVTDLVELYVEERESARSKETRDILSGAAGVFFTGGDQLRISSQIGDTPIEEMVRDLHRRGGVVAGTSAGASVMSETMLVRGSSGESHRIGDLNMAPGLGLIADVIIDQHFAERGRIGRLLGAVAQNPRVLGIGIDEDTAIVVEKGFLKVIGSGAVYIVDGSDVTHSNVAEARQETPLSMFGVRLHVIAAGDCFDLEDRQPSAAA
jgi:cyanophycinase